jgi:hypothetical protein
MVQQWLAWSRDQAHSKSGDLIEVSTVSRVRRGGFGVTWLVFACKRMTSGG